MSLSLYVVHTEMHYNQSTQALAYGGQEVTHDADEELTALSVRHAGDGGGQFVLGEVAGLATALEFDSQGLSGGDDFSGVVRAGHSAIVAVACESFNPGEVPCTNV